jgi:hypothetical protein
MKATVYVVVTYHGYHGDEVCVFGTQAEAEACVMEYAKEIWRRERLGRFPKSYASLYETWAEHDLWGSTDSRWELEEREVELPEPASSAARS